MSIILVILDILALGLVFVLGLIIGSILEAKDREDTINIRLSHHTEYCREFMKK